MNGKCRRRKRVGKRKRISSKKAADSNCTDKINENLKLVLPGRLVPNYISQNNQIEKFISQTLAKRGKANIFSNTSNMLALVGGGDPSNLKCSGGWQVA